MLTCFLQEGKISIAPHFDFSQRSFYITYTGERVKVRRNFYPQSSPAGQGAVWQWKGDAAGDWHVYDMLVQCIIEESWATVSYSGWWIFFLRFSQKYIWSM